MLIIQLGHGLSQWPNTRRRSILTAMACDVYLLGPVEAALNLVVDFRGTLPQVRPLLGVLEEAILVGTLGSPDYTGRGTGCVETCVRLVAFVGLTKLPVDFGAELCSRSTS